MKPDSQPAGKASIGTYNEHTANPFRGDSPIKDVGGQIAGIGVAYADAEGAIVFQDAIEFTYPGDATDGYVRAVYVPG